MKLYSVDILLCATAYVLAESEAEALETVRGLDGNGLELPTGYAGENVEISGESFNPDMPPLSLSPAVTVYASDISPDLMKYNPIKGVDFQEDFGDGPSCPWPMEMGDDGPIVDLN